MRSQSVSDDFDCFDRFDHDACHSTYEHLRGVYKSIEAATESLVEGVGKMGGGETLQLALRVVRDGAEREAEHNRLERGLTYKRGADGSCVLVVRGDLGSEGDEMGWRVDRRSLAELRTGEHATDELVIAFLQGN